MAPAALRDRIPPLGFIGHGAQQPGHDAGMARHDIHQREELGQGLVLVSEPHNRLAKEDPGAGPHHGASLVGGRVRSPDHARAQGAEGVWQGCPRQ